MCPLESNQPFQEIGTPAPADEAGLVERARTEPEAFAQLYRRHHPLVARYVRRRVGDEHATEDLVAETFATALARLERYTDRGLPFRVWLYAIATNAVNAWARRARRRGAALLEEEPAAREATAIFGKEEAELARTALLALPPRYQTALALHYLEELSVAEIAAITGCRPGTVKARLLRGRERLREKLVQLDPRNPR